MSHAVSLEERSGACTHALQEAQGFSDRCELSGTGLRARVPSFGFRLAGFELADHDGTGNPIDENKSPTRAFCGSELSS